MKYADMDAEALRATEQRVEQHLAALRGRNFQIDMTRGKPSAEQLDLTAEMMTIVGPDDCHGLDGTDYRNYGLGTGIPEAKALFAAYLEVPPDAVIVGGNSSLNLMYDALAGAVLYGVPGGDGPWRARAGLKFLCPVPGYDRHFLVCERLGLTMIPIEMTDEGPDMDHVEALVAEDAAIKGIWCVPKYSNPTGITYSDRVVDRLAAMKTAAADFRIMWDNAYAVHHLGDQRPVLRNIFEACAAKGTADRPLMFASTSKISYAGAGLAVMAASPANIRDAAAKMAVATIGPDKINQLRHVLFFRDMAGVHAHMDRHRALLAPKFAALDGALEGRLGGKGLAEWTKPEGGYFVSVDVLDGCATEAVRLAGEAGLALVPAGATFPYGRDPRDRNIRLAPTMLSLAEIDRAMDIFCISVERACVAKLRASEG